MPRVRFRDLPEHGLIFITPHEAEFGRAAQDILERSIRFNEPTAEDLETSAILWNVSGKAIIAFAIVRRYTGVGGRTWTGTMMSLGSSQQLDILAGRAAVEPSARCPFILPGSRRLSVPRGMFGDNSDVTGADEVGGGGGIGAGGSGSRSGSEPIEEVEVIIDAAFFHDGVCVGPDESQLFEQVESDIRAQRELAEEVSTAIRGGATAGQIVDRFRPGSRHPRIARGRRSPEAIAENSRSQFAQWVLNTLVHQPDDQVLAWLESFRQPPRIELRRG